MSMKDIDTFIQHFIQKCVQVIVQSRLGTERTETKCNPNGKDWFWLSISDIQGIREQTTSCLNRVSQSSNQFFFVKSNWKICCEISLKNSDGISLVLEYWVFSNFPNYEAFDRTGQDRHSAHQTIIRMSNLIKSLIVLTRSTPAYRLSCKGQSADSYVICYRVYECGKNGSFQNEFPELVDQSSHYSQIKNLGTIKSSFNEILLSLIYRIDMNVNTDSEIKNLKDKLQTDMINSTDSLLIPVKDDHFFEEDTNSAAAINDFVDFSDILKPLNPAFASKESDENISLVSTSLISLLKIQDDTSNDTCSKIKKATNKDNQNSIASSPIKIPKKVQPSNQLSKSPQIYSTSNESFVFVELNAPFASDDREFESFFHGPSPTFVTLNNENLNNDINEICSQLAELESNVPQLDSFVESICIQENEDAKCEN